MPEQMLKKRFGTAAIERGFITKDQFVEAMAIQVESDLEGTEHITIGAILQAIGYMDMDQVMEVLGKMDQGMEVAGVMA